MFFSKKKKKKGGGRLWQSGRQFELGTQWGSACTELEHGQENCQTSQGEKLWNGEKLLRIHLKAPLHYKN